MDSHATVYTRGQPEEVREKLAQVSAVLAGTNWQASNLREALLTRIGLVLLMLIKEAFVIKARGGTDAAGISWKPLTREYIAYTRRHPGLPQAKDRRRPGHLLTSEQEALWWKTYYRNLARFANRKGADLRGAKGHAAAIAWIVVKEAGGKTIIGEYGDTRVEIGRDTGRLLNSLSPGIQGPSGDPDQIFRTETNAVIVGSNRPGVEHFHKLRPLWKENGDEWPREWWEQINEALESGVVRLLEHLAAA